MNANHAIGTLVINPNKPEWGPGKVVHVQGQLTYVVFRDVPGRDAKGIRTDVVPLLVAPDLHDDILDNLPPVQLVGGKYVLPAERVTVKQAIDRFLHRFPNGFRDEEYIGTPKRGERMYKVLGHQHFIENLGGSQFRDLLSNDVAELTRRVIRCVARVNLLYPVEQAAFRDAMTDVNAAHGFFKALHAVLEAKEVSEESFGPYLQAAIDLPAERARVASWPVVTILPFLAQPDRHMFVKPSITVEAAERLGFCLNYRAEPNWLTYASVLRMADIYRTHLAQLEPEDLIDIQSFFYVTCGGYGN